MPKIMALCEAQGMAMVMRVAARYLCLGDSSIRTERTAGTLHPMPSTQGRMAAPCRPILCMSASRMTLRRGKVADILQDAQHQVEGNQERQYHAQRNIEACGEDAEGLEQLWRGSDQNRPSARSELMWLSTKALMNWE